MHAHTHTRTLAMYTHITQLSTVPPDQPHALTVENSEATSISISWEPRSYAIRSGYLVLHTQCQKCEWYYWWHKASEYDK